MRRAGCLGVFLCALSAACGGSQASDELTAPIADAGDDAAGAGGSGGLAGGAGASGGSAGQPSGGSGGAAAACSLAPKPAGTTTFDVSSSGAQRKARLVIPPGYDATRLVPLVMVFHGYLGNPQQMDDATGMTEVAAQAGAIVVYPEGLNTSWNAGKCCGTSANVQRPDVKFVSDLLDALEAELCIDPRRVYAAGFSNGGMLSNRLGCELGGRIAAIAPVAGPLAVDGCSPVRPVPMIEFHGTADIVVPYTGNGLGGAISVAENVEFWRNNAGCADSAPAQVFKNGDTTCSEYQQCSAGAAIRLCTVQDGGHQWPGGKNLAVGKLTQDIDASSEMMAFFLAHPLP